MRRIFPLNRGVYFGVALILIIILIVLTKMAFSPTNKLPTKNFSSLPAPTPTIVSIKSCSQLPMGKDRLICEEAANREQRRMEQPVPTVINDVSCGSFPIASGEISCEEAKQIALEKYPGTITAVSKMDLPENRAWLVQVNLNNSSERARLGINRVTKEIFMNLIKK